MSSSQKTVGILGGGQLGRMLAHPASLLSIPLLILDAGSQTPAKQVILPPVGHDTHIDGPFNSSPHIKELASKVDILTVEIEHVNADVLAEIEAEGKVEVHPSSKTIKVIQDKFEQKKYLVKNGGVDVAEFVGVERDEKDTSVVEKSISEAVQRLGLPLMLKARTLAYDGRGNYVLKELSSSAIKAALDFLGDRPLYAEKWAPFDREIAVMVVRTTNGEVKSYDPVETVHEDSVLRLTLCPLRANGGREVNKKAKQLAEKAVACLSGAGIFGVEMFLMPDGSLLINEIAPRPHNSGHHTIEASHTSQFENHLRAITGLPLGSTALKVPSTAMINLIGLSSTLDSIDACISQALATTGASVHMYGKTECRKGRKMGHITVVADSDEELLAKVGPILKLSLPVQSTLPEKYCPITPQAVSSPNPLVGIIMGSDSDLPVMAAAAQILRKFKVPFELTIVSAHRTPDRMVTYARDAPARGLRCLIAGAGGAAHLPGMVAALTPLPVVGVPVKGSVLDGVDSLHSIVQMPRGIPVATVAINNSTNAGLLAVRIISASVPHLIQDMQDYMDELEAEVMAKAEKLEAVGFESYLEGMGKKV
ncbi:phosphoribosylaminoimidazole carboxylase [Phaffia rhodozyma]|uniref:Phosphoribosylaminoimidazole carboxylase n=1 Tax=Phaffia rhodozyma TaxID=264483 RepID=A0A0F7SI68_PHARH|nr:phosphoribosylaminoimidazole carboxylase [Phaffia rhodozyma]